MGFYDEHVLPRIIDLALGKAQDPTRAKIAARLEGEVLEVGFGSGRNLPHLPSAVTKLLAVEPAALGRKLAAPRIAASPVPVEVIGLDGQDLPLDDASVDHALITWSLCTIPDVDRALREVHRVLRPGGMLHFVEHGRSPNPATARWQDRLTPLWGRIAGGCHLNRPIREHIEAASFEIVDLDTYSMGGPDVIGYSYRGRASKAT